MIKPILPVDLSNQLQELGLILSPLAEEVLWATAILGNFKVSDRKYLIADRRSFGSDRAI